MRLINAVRELRVEHGARPPHDRPAHRGRAARRCSCARPTRRCASTTAVRRTPAARTSTSTRSSGRCVAARADAAWVGWGFVAERPEFAELCERLGIVFVGPSAEVMRRLGDKIGAKLLAEQAGVPVAPWSGGPVDDARRGARATPSAIGYPLMIKATAGGGGRGIRRVDDDDGLAEAFESARAEGAQGVRRRRPCSWSASSTGARHVEVQVIADAPRHGVGGRRARLQHAAPQPEGDRGVALHRARRPSRIATCAPRPCAWPRLAGYANAGTVEFLYQPAEQRFAFLEVNTRLQVEHPVTELTTGLDLVKLQLHVAAGGRLEGDPPPTRGLRHRGPAQRRGPAARLRPGARARSRRCRCPSGPGIRVDTGVAEGDVIPPEFDSMIAKVIAYGRDRDEALGPAAPGAVADDGASCDGGTTNKSFLLDLLDRPGGARRRRSTRLARPAHRGRRAPADAPRRRRPRRRGARRRRAARRASSGPRSSAGRAAAGRRPTPTIGREIELRHGGQPYRRRRPPTRRRRGTRSSSTASRSPSTSSGSVGAAAG